MWNNNSFYVVAIYLFNPFISGYKCKKNKKNLKNPPKARIFILIKTRSNEYQINLNS